MFAHISRRLMTTFTTAVDKLNYVSGQRVLGHGGAFDVFEPATGEKLCDCPSSTKDDVEQAVSAAHSSSKAWGALSGFERGRVLNRVAELIRANLEKIAQLETTNNGKPIGEARIDIEQCADTWSYYGGVAATLNGEHIQLPNGSFAYTRREALGVVAGIGAWNYPFQTMTWKCAPALACGNSFIYKPSPFTPYTAVVLAELLAEAGLPTGVIGVVQGERDTGEALCLHRQVNKVSFTGSVPTGQAIMKMCASEGLRHVTLEMGGKSPLIIFDDADMHNAVIGALMANFFTQGEVCSNGARVFVHRSIVKEFTERIVAETRKIRLGDPQKEETRMGAMIRKEHMEKVLNYVQSARDEGATILVGGERTKVSDARCANGYFISPCVIDNCTDAMRVIREEIFGPVLCILPFDTEEEVVRRANDTEFGLAAGLFTRDLNRAHRVASQLEAGSLYINTHNAVPVEVPFGGYKNSGFGRELGLAALNSYSQLKSVYVETAEKLENPFH